MIDAWLVSTASFRIMCAQLPRSPHSSSDLRENLLLKQLYRFTAVGAIVNGRGTLAGRRGIDNPLVRTFLCVPQPCRSTSTATDVPCQEPPRSPATATGINIIPPVGLPRARKLGGKSAGFLRSDNNIFAFYRRGLTQRRSVGAR